MKSFTVAKIGAALGLAALSSGCLTVFPDPKPAPQIFQLEPREHAFASAPKVEWTISVARPAASRALSGADLVLREGENRVVYVEGSEWAEPVPDLMQRALTASLDRSGKIIAVTPEAGARADCELQWDLYAFDVVEHGHRFSARFEASVRLIEGRRRMIMGSTQVSSKGEAQGDTARAAAAALTQAALAGLDQAGAWALAQQCEKLPRPPVGPAVPLATRPEAPLAGAPEAVSGARPVLPAPPAP
ncbi:MAG: ABC-type transport auxiliary lipoprotein family protein [Caulobacterales bacterium]